MAIPSRTAKLALAFFTVKNGLTEAFAYSQSDEFLRRLAGDQFVQTSSLAVLGGEFHGESLID